MRETNARAAYEWIVPLQWGPRPLCRHTCCVCRATATQRHVGGPSPYDLTLCSDACAETSGQMRDIVADMSNCWCDLQLTLDQEERAWQRKARESLRVVRQWL